MATEKLYFDDPSLLEFEATVLESRPHGSHHAVLLDRTAFYPTSGGQPNDTGQLNEARVLDCIEDEQHDAILHIVDRPLEPGRVHGAVDADRRLDHMQQHSGQHVLSQALVEKFNWPTVSFHLGAAFCTIDLAAESAPRSSITEAEILANRIVRENRSVSIRYVPSAQIHEAGLRKQTSRTGDIRVIDMDGFDRSACCGTHVRRTAEIGPILVTGIERAKKQTRIEFLCGERAIRHSRDMVRVLQDIARTVSAPVLETARAVQTLNDDYGRVRKSLKEMEEALIGYEAAQFPVADGFAVAAFANRGLDAIKLLAIKVCQRPGVVALFADQSEELRVVFARSADRTEDAAALLKAVLAKFGGRGGGRPQLAQGGGLTAPSAQTVLDFARRL